MQTPPQKGEAAGGTRRVHAIWMTLLRHHRSAGNPTSPPGAR